MFDRVGAGLDVVRFGEASASLAYWGPDSSSLWKGPQACLGKHALHATEEGSAANAIQVEETGHGAVALAADARLDNRSELKGRLGRYREGLGEVDAALMLRAYLKWGSDFAERLLGDFAIAIWDGRTRTLVLVRDHVGVKPLYYFASTALAVFASEPGALPSLAELPQEWDLEWMATSLMGAHCVETQGRTHLKGVELVRNGEVVQVGRQGVRCRRYWRLRPVELPGMRSQAEYIEGFRWHLGQSVEARLRGAPQVALELSSGLDSSSVAYFARSMGAGKRFSCYTHALGSGALGRDEFDQADRYARWLGWGGSSRVSGSRGGLLELFRGSGGQRLGGAVDGWTLYGQALYDTAGSSGAKILLTGAGGDDLATCRVGPANARLFREGAWLWIAGQLWDEGRRRGRGAGHRLAPLGRLFASEVLGGVSWLWRQPRVHFARRELVRRYSVEERLQEQLAAEAAMTIPARQVWRATNHYLSHSRFPESAFAARARGLEVRHPMMDKRLLEFCLSVPPSCLRGDGFGRYLARASLEGAPDWCRWREEKEVAAVPWAVSNLANEARPIAEALQEEAWSIAHEVLDLDLVWGHLNALGRGGPNACDAATRRSLCRVLGLALGRGAFG